MIEWFDSSTPVEKVSKFCEAAQTDPSPAAVNYTSIDWQHRPETLMYKMFTEKVFDRENGGGYAVSTNGTDYFTGAGICRWSDDANTCIYPFRLYTNLNHRGAPEARFIHVQFPLYDLIKELGYKACFASTDHYNRRILRGAYETNNPANFPNYYFDGENHYTGKEGRRIIPVTMYDLPLIINHTKQWLHYHCIDPLYEPILLAILNELAVE
jgi:hypothetical protein